MKGWCNNQPNHCEAHCDDNSGPFLGPLDSTAVVRDAVSRRYGGTVLGIAEPPEVRTGLSVFLVDRARIRREPALAEDVEPCHRPAVEWYTSREKQMGLHRPCGFRRS